jgi:hypothetical protein
VDVIRHDDERAKLVSLAVEKAECVCDDLRERWLTQEAFAHSRIKEFVQLLGEVPVECAALFFRQILHIIDRVTVVCTEPECTVFKPRIERGFWDGITKAGGDEICDAVLPPVRQVIAKLLRLSVRAEGLESRAFRMRNVGEIFNLAFSTL